MGCVFCASGVAGLKRHLGPEEIVGQVLLGRSLLREGEALRNVVLMGVHTHYCVLGRSFGIRAMVKLGKNVVLCRDLTDAMYDPRKPPYVSHQRGTELAVEHIEKYWCPSITSSDLVTVVPGSADPVPAATGK